jgi:DNA topoisomerase-1
LKTGKFGAFIGCSNYPECKFTRQLSASENDDAESGDRVLGVDPESQLEVWLKIGRFGPYVQLGEPEKDSKEKPKRSSIPKTWNVEDTDLEKALMLLSLPRQVGAHPEDGEMIEANLGRFGPYVKHGKTYANVPTIEDVFEIGLNRAVTLIAEKRANPRGNRGAAKPLRELGAHPESGDPVNVMDGRYGPYVKHGKTNATLPKDMKPDAVTLEQALVLLAEREKKAPAKKKATKKKATKKAAAKKTATKKATAKKTATKKTAKKKATKKKAAD